MNACGPNKALVELDKGMRTFWKSFNQRSIDDLLAFSIHDTDLPLNTVCRTLLQQDTTDLMWTEIVSSDSGEKHRKARGDSRSKMTQIRGAKGAWDKCGSMFGFVVAYLLR